MRQSCQPADAMLLRSALIAAALALLSILVLDGPIAVAMSSVPVELKRAITQGVIMCEWLFGFHVSRYLYGGVLILAGLLAIELRRATVARALLFIGLAHVTARLVAGVMKLPFSRLRPFEAFANGTWHDTWFAPVGNSFPSGHAVHFWSLFFPLAVLFPQYWIPLAVLPVLISIARVVVNDHYLSDVIASVAVAALVTWIYSKTIWSASKIAAFVRRMSAGEFPLWPRRAAPRETLRDRFPI
jgi:membrane-associated phospholipid phosphatase